MSGTGQRRSLRHPMIKSPDQLTTGERAADLLRNGMGSWGFVLAALAFLAGWMVANGSDGFDPYPFILLNLALSFQAAYAAPFIMMSQNRQQQVDRTQAADDYRINIKAELEIELLHEKIDGLREKEVWALTQAVEALTHLLQPKETDSDR